MELISDDNTGIRFYPPQDWTCKKLGLTQWIIVNSKKKIGAFTVTIMPEKTITTDKELWLRAFLESDGAENFTIKESGKFALGESTITADGEVYELKYWMHFIDGYGVVVMYTCPLSRINKEDKICEQFINSFTSINVN